MSRGYMSSRYSDYVCYICGDIFKTIDHGTGREKKYTIKQMYCPICMTETDHIRLGDKDIVRFELESKNILEGMDYEVYNLLTKNDYKEKTR